MQSFGAIFLIVILIFVGVAYYLKEQGSSYLHVGVDYDNHPLKDYGVELGQAQLPNVFTTPKQKFMQYIDLARFMDVENTLCWDHGNTICVEIRNGEGISKILFYRLYGGRDAHDKKANLSGDFVAQKNKYGKIYGDFECERTVSEDMINKINRREVYYRVIPIVEKCDSTFNSPVINLYMTLDSAGGDLITVFSK